MQKQRLYERLKRIAPWFAGASLGATHIALSRHCSVTTAGHCNRCGSCAVALVALVSWAVMKRNHENTEVSD